MAVLTSNQIVKTWGEGTADRVMVYALRNVTAADTADLVSDFTKLIRGVLLGTTVAGALAAAVSGTVVTMPAGLSGDAGYLMVWGCAGGN